MSEQEEIEKTLRERLEKSGQMGKMRAMIVEAALNALYAKQDNGMDETDNKLNFEPSASLIEAKSSARGKEMLATIYYLMGYLGLEYTASVFCMETGLAETEFSKPSKNSSIDLQAIFSEKFAPIALANPPERQVNPVKQEGHSLEPVSPHKVSEVLEENKQNVVNDVAGEQPGGEDTTYRISSWKNRTFVRAHGSVSGQQVQLEYLTNCNVLILDPLDSITVDDCEAGELVIAACEGSVFLRNCKDMAIHVACKQLRTRDCANLNLFTFTTTDPVIEMSHHLTFRPFHLCLPELKSAFKAARLDPTLNRFVHVYDFTENEITLPKPHFTVLYPEHALSLEARYAEYGIPECPREVEELLKGDLQPACSSESGKNKSYDIKTGSKVWAKMGFTDTDDSQKSPVMPQREPSSSPSNVMGGAKSAKNDNWSEVKQPEQGKAPQIGVDTVDERAGRPPTAPSTTQLPSTIETDADGMASDDQDYSSFESDTLSSENEKYQVDEDDDDF